MKKFYLLSVSFILFTFSAFAFNVTLGYAYNGSVGDSIKTRSSKGKITDTRKNNPSSAGNRIKLDFIPFKLFNTKELNTTGNTPAAVKTVKQADDGKILNNVKVYPNPVEDEMNLSYHISKDSNVTIKIMDVLGNEITTLFSQKIAAGEQSNTFNLSSKLKSGFYFIRLVVGQETIIKRISVL